MKIYSFDDGFNKLDSTYGGQKAIFQRGQSNPWIVFPIKIPFIPLNPVEGRVSFGSGVIINNNN